MLSAHGFTDQPIGGCAVADNVGSTPNPQDVSAIVQQVVAELSRRGLM
jgi:4-hydroxy-tetrahydrodipicolinate synthase